MTMANERVTVRVLLLLGDQAELAAVEVPRGSALNRSATGPPTSRCPLAFRLATCPACG
jgi:hypothetical protein